MLIANITEVTDENFEFAGMFTVRLQEVIITDTSGGSGSGLSAANQADPASTAPETNAGSQSLQSAPDASLYQSYDYASFGSQTQRVGA